MSYFLVLGNGQEYGFGYTGTRPVLPYYGYSGKMEKSHTVARITGVVWLYHISHGRIFNIIL